MVSFLLPQSRLTIEQSFLAVPNLQHLHDFPAWLQETRRNQLTRYATKWKSEMQTGNARQELSTGCQAKNLSVTKTFLDIHKAVEKPDVFDGISYVPLANSKFYEQYVKTFGNKHGAGCSTTLLDFTHHELTPNNKDKCQDLTKLLLMLQMSASDIFRLTKLYIPVFGSAMAGSYFYMVGYFNSCFSS